MFGFLVFNVSARASMQFHTHKSPSSDIQSPRSFAHLRKKTSDENHEETIK